MSLKKYQNLDETIRKILIISIFLYIFIEGFIALFGWHRLIGLNMLLPLESQGIGFFLFSSSLILMLVALYSFKDKWQIFLLTFLFFVASYFYYYPLVFQSDKTNTFFNILLYVEGCLINAIIIIAFVKLFLCFKRFFRAN